MMQASAQRRYGRLGWLATTLAMAVALVLSAGLNHRAATDAADNVTRGQADLLRAALNPIVQPGMDSQLLAQNLESFVAAHADKGVRFVALLNPDSSVAASAGEASAAVTMPPADVLPGAVPTIVRVGDRVRFYSLRPFPRTGSPPDGPRTMTDAARAQRSGESGQLQRGDFRGRGERGQQPGDFRDRRPRVLHYSLIEFEPVQAQRLVGRARRSLLLAFAGATILTLAALLFYRTQQQYDQARTRLEEQKRLTLLGEMSAVLAHEIRNPLASLKGNAQLLTEKLPADSRERARADRVVAEATRLEALTTDLLDFARSGPLELQSVNPKEVLLTSIADVQEDGFAIDMEHAPGQWPMDQKRIRHALVNLLQNARQASAGRPDPQVRVAEEKGALVFEVRDFGAGLPPGREDRIFDPFFTTRTNGTGLGLAVARRIAEMHGGRIGAFNHSEGGAVFRIELPGTAA